MAAFFHGGSEIQDPYSDLTLQQQNPSLMNPNCLIYPTTRFFNPFAGHELVHAPPTEQLLVGVPTTVDMSTTIGHNHHHYYNLFFGSHLDHPNPTHNINSDSVESQEFDLLPREPPLLPLAVVSSGNCKRLSLSLSSQQPPPAAAAAAGVPYMPSGDTNHMEQGNSPVSSTVSNGIVLGVTQYGGRGGGGGVFDPKYMKAARELLYEIVSIGNNNVNGFIEKIKMEKESTAVDRISGSGSENIGGGGRAVGGDLTTANKQELQIKKAKLVSMVGEVEQRYKQYRHQMQTIVSSFEQAAGFGSARSYTTVALQTISKQFRSLKDSISSQIKIINKSLGEEGCVGAKGDGSRFGRFIMGHHNHNYRQIRHLGMIQNYHHNDAWRPQRGLPERAVSVLRAWLFEHFLHPYPRDSDKQMLAKQTGLTRSQVSNWFINARVRLWKPMVEEMYLEEMMDQSQTKSHNLNQPSSLKQPSNYVLQKHNNSSSDQCSSSNIVHSTSYLSTLVSPRIKKPEKMTTVQNDVVPVQHSSGKIVSFDMAGATKEHGDHTAMTAVGDFNGGFGNYNAIYGNRVSLSLGLPRSCDKSIVGNIQFGKRSHQIEFSGVSSSSTYQNFDVSDKKGFDAAVTAVTAAAPLLLDYFA